MRLEVDMRSVLLAFGAVICLLGCEVNQGEKWLAEEEARECRSDCRNAGGSDEECRAKCAHLEP